MPLVIAGGPSVGDYERLHLENLARMSFVFAVNDTCFDFPCDVVVSIDPQMIVKRKEELKKLGKPIITRCWWFTQDGGKEYGLDIITLSPMLGVRNENYDQRIIKHYPLSGMLACKLSDRLSIACGQGRKSYVLGMDATQGHYKGHPIKQDDIKYLDEARPLSKYEDMALTNTVNLSVHSKIPTWPKQSKLPKIEKVIVSPVYRAMAMAWLRANAHKEVFEGVK